VSHPKQADLEALLEALLSGGVEFIVVGGAACVLHGAPTATQDLDIVHRRTKENVRRLMTVLGELDARIRDPAGRILRPTESALLGDGQLNLATKLGPLDPLCQLHDGRDYEALIGHTEQMTDEELTIAVLDLPTLIEVKRRAGRARDRIMLPILLKLLQQRNDDDDDQGGT
jgi:hypothetical protein